MKKNISYKIFIVGLLTLIPFYAASQVATSTENVSKFAKLVENIDVSLCLTGESSLYTPKSSEYSLTSNSELGIGYTSSSKVATSLAIGVDKDLTNEREQALTDTTVSVRKKLFSLGKYSSVSGMSSVILPTSEDSRDTNRMYAGFVFSPSISFDLKMIGLKYVNFKYAIIGSQYFHEYTRNINNRANTEKRLSNSFSLSYSPFEFLNISSGFSINQKWNYEGNSNGPSYGSNFTIVGTVSNNFEVATGISTSGSMYKANGRDSNVKLYDTTSTTAFLSLTVSI